MRILTTYKHSTMDTQQMQGQSPQPDMTQKANQAAASLAFATHLQTQMLQHQAPEIPAEVPVESPQTPQNAPDSTNDEKPEEDTLKKLVTEVDSLKKEVKGKNADKEIEDIRSQLEQLLKEEGQDDVDDAEESNEPNDTNENETKE